MLFSRKSFGGLVYWKMGPLNKLRAFVDVSKVQANLERKQRKKVSSPPIEPMRGCEKQLFLNLTRQNCSPVYFF